ncbi:EMX1 isoform 4 [Pongo abelii]|uniref:EMX1 isoform 4 n=1 Tax=Pongo abelii TaxID=9601 RepID=H2P5V2_PONAB|nr:EMX1 isoform 4 [Pongo abelii]
MGPGNLASFNLSHSVSEALAWSGPPTLELLEPQRGRGGGSPSAEARRPGPSRSRHRGWALELLPAPRTAGGLQWDRSGGFSRAVPRLAPCEESERPLSRAVPRDIQKTRNLRNKVAASDSGPGGRYQRRAPGRAASARPLRTQAQADPHGLLALAAAAAGARLREEPLRGGRRAEAAGRQSQPLRDAGEGVVPEPEDKVQTAEAGGGRA